jgi:hypothetical protein
MNVRVALALAVFVSTLAASAGAVQPDADLIARLTGVQPEVKDGVVKISVPRDDLTVAVDGVRMRPFQGLTSWAAFQAGGERTLLMGDLTLTEAEVAPAMSAALDAGLEVTALHNHFLFDQPRVFFMHIGGTGTTEQLAGAVRRTLDAAHGAPRSRKAPAVPATSTIDAKPLEEILGASGQAKDGMVKFVFGRKTSMHGAEVGPAMGVNTWAAFAGSPRAAVVDGDFAVLEGELQGVLKALRAAGIEVVAIHSHMTHEQPRIVFLHYWATGPADALARGLRSALDTQRG